MAREYAKNWITTWTDEDFCTQPIFDKLLYQVLLGQPPTLLNYAGVQPLSLRRWRKAMRDGDHMPGEEHIMAALARLEDRDYVYTDDDTCEVLIRSFIRRDEVTRQPYVMLSALRFAVLVESPKIASVLLTELTQRITVPAVEGTTDRAKKLREGLNRGFETAVTHLETLSNGVSKPFPKPFPMGYSRPAETPNGETLSNGVSKGSPIGSVVVEVEVAKSPPIDGYFGEGAAQTDETADTQPPPHPDAPPRTCPKHPNGTDKPCTACATARNTHNTWTEKTARAERARDRAEAAKRVQAARNAAHAITNCTLCDDNGYQGPKVCDHTDRTDTNRRGLELVRAALTPKADDA
jgi:hypothetical protein